MHLHGTSTYQTSVHRRLLCPPLLVHLSVLHILFHTIIDPSLTAVCCLSTRSTCIFRSHLPLLIFRLRARRPQTRTYTHTHSSVHSPSSQPPLISSPSPHAHIRTYPISTHCDHHACHLSPPTSHRTRYILRRVCSFGCSIAPQTRIQSHFSSDNRRQDKPNKARFGLFIFRRQSTTKTLHCRGSWHWQPRKNVFLCNLIICTLQQRRGL